jgi:hypothetical protein
MNHPSLTHPSNSPLRGAPRALAGSDALLKGLSLNGLTLFAIGLLVVASGYMALRPTVMGLALHLSLVPVALAFPLVFLSRINLFPTRILVALVIFAGMYCFSIINGLSVQLSEMFKIIAAVVTIITCALLVRKRGDFVAGALGLSIGVALLAAPGMANESHAGVEVMEGANKNTFSLYALPAILIAGFICTRWKDVPKIVKVGLVVSMLPALAAIFLSANRSGYLGAVLVALMIFWDQRGRGMLLVGVIALMVIGLIARFGDTETLDRRINQTIEGNQSDDLRVAIIQACGELALENPLIGVSPQRLPFEIARKVEMSNWTQLDSHNVFGHIAAGSGFICLSALLAAGWAMWTWGPGLHKIPKDDPLYAPRRLLRMMVILWVIRGGLFTREVMYNPSFCIGLGLCIGLCILGESARKTAVRRQPVHPAAPPGWVPVR